MIVAKTQLPPPKNQSAKLLKAMIEGRTITEQDFRMNGFRTRISELKREYDFIHSAWKDFVNEFGEHRKCRTHFILEVDREEAITVYEKINK